MVFTQLSSMAYRLVFLYCFLNLPLLVQSQEVLLSDFQITGNKRTKESVILRELDIHIGDTLSIAEWETVKKRNEEWVMNAGLFTEVILGMERIGENEATITIEVQEFWYIFPLVLFRLADRNFSIWWTEQNRSLDRVNYGMRFFHHNLTGRRDRLRLITQLGFLKVLELAYDLPMVGDHENLGVFGDIHFSNQKQVAYVTQGSRLQFFGNEEESVLLKRFRVGAGSTYRDGLFKYHTAKVFYSSSWIGQEIADLNPEYFLNGITRQQHFTFQYDFTIDRRDVKVYPLKGDQFSFFVQKDGFGFAHEDIQVLSTQLSYARFFPLGKKQIHTFGAKINGRYTFNRNQQPYTHTSAVGYIPNVLKGYEFYVMDGLDFGLLKTHFRFQLLKKDIQWGKWVFLEQFRFMPLKVYFTVNNDVGYVHAPYDGIKSTLSNQWLWGRGVGIDFLFYYNRLLRFEYSFNHLGERGLFFSWDLAF